MPDGTVRLVITVLVVASLLALGVLSLPDGSDRSAPGGALAAAEAEAPEPRLGAEDLTPAPETPSRPGGGKRPAAARIPPASGDAASSEEVPQHILEENHRIRRDLEDLKKLEQERAQVARLLTRAGAGYDGPLRLGPSGMAWPVNGSVVSPFGQRWGRLHAGIDIAASTGTVIRAAADGKVVIAAPTGGYGNYVCIQHTARLSSCYAHLSQYLTNAGTIIRQGQPLGLVGCTGHCFGPHLHFETWVDGTPVDPVGYL